MGEGKADKKGYEITEKCIGCGKCERICPQKAIVRGEKTAFRIRQEHCLHCGNCYENCPNKAVKRRM